MKMNFANEIELRDYASTLLDLMSASDRFIIEMYYFKGFTKTMIGKNLMSVKPGYHRLCEIY